MLRVVLLAGGLIASCVSSAPLDPAAPLPSGVWRVESLGEQPLVQAVQSTVQFEAGGEIHGLGGCNRFSGTYRIEGDTLRVGPLATTEMACAEAVMLQEARLLAALEESERFELADGALRLFSKSGGTAVQFVPVTP